MSEDTTPAPPPSTSPPRRRSPIVVLVAIVALVAAAAWWFATGGKQAQQQSETAALQARVDQLAHAVEQLRGGADALRARLDDSVAVDKSEREELLALGERTRLVEDAVANLADKRLSAHDTLALDEAELLLGLGGERYVLFHDAASAIDVYQAADAALAQVEDAAFSTVRQSIAGEIDALKALPAAQTGALAAKLGQLREQLQQLPVAQHLQEPAPENSSRLWRVLGAFVQVHRGADARSEVVRRDAGLARELVVLDVRDAQAALLARDDAHYHAALASLRTQLGAFDPAAAQPASTTLAELDKAALAPAPPPALGAALKELRNLRATHALRNAKPPKADEAQK